MAAAQNSLNINTSGVVAYNATTGVFTQSAITQYDTLVGGASNAIVSIAPGTTGQVLTSNGASASPSYQTVVSALAWSNITTTTQTIAGGSGYITNNAATVTYTLPASPTQGQVFAITSGASAAATTPWSIAQPATQSINFGNLTTTVGVGGSLASTLKFDTVYLVCVVAGTAAVWNVTSSVGNLIVT